jgi:hypothetical protein
MILDGIRIVKRDGDIGIQTMSISDINKSGWLIIGKYKIY